jgi:cytochrome c oxidase subunit 1
MTLTATRPPEAPAAPPDVPVLLPETWLTTSDHKRLGRLYIVAATAFALLGVAVGLAMEVSRARSGSPFAGDVYERLFNLHTTTSVLLFLIPLWIGLATYVVPLQIGARRLAFPRVQALALWTYVGAGLLLLGSFAVGRPIGAGVFSSSPLPATGPAGAGGATDLWAASLIALALASILAAGNLFVTILKLRAEGLTLPRLPGFSWSVLATSAAVVISTPMFVAGMVLVYIDQHFGSHLFTVVRGAQVNGDIVWEHLVWFYGRPEGYLLFVPALGAATDIVVTHSRRRLFMPPVVKGAIFAFAVLSFGILAAPHSALSAVLLPTPTIVSALVVLPAGLCALLWLATVRPDDLHMHVSLLYVVGFVLLCVFGGVNAVVAALKNLHGGSAWTTGQIHAVLVGAPTLALFGAVYHWSPKLWGRHLRGSLGVLQWLLLFGGFTVAGLGGWLLGYDGAPWHTASLSGPGTKSGWIALSRIGTAGEVLVVLGFLVFAINALASVFGSGTAAEDDPYQGQTLEWATTSPPPDDNFAYVPEVRSEAPLLDVRAADASSSTGGAD